MFRTDYLPYCSALAKRLVTCVSVLGCALCASAAHAQNKNVALDGSLPPRNEWRASSSAVEGPGLAASFAIDGDPKTRWGGSFSWGHWFQVDLGRASAVGGVLISWDTGFARRYFIQSSMDSKKWSTAFTAENSPGSLDYVFFPAVQARYLRLAAVQRTADWGVSVFEFEPLAQRDSPQVLGLTGENASGIWTRNQSRTFALGTKPTEPELLVQLPKALPVAGLEVTWDKRPRGAKLEGRTSSGQWQTLAEDPDSSGDSSFLAAREALSASALRLTTTNAAAPPSLKRIRIISPSQVITALKRYEIAASRADKKLFPASLRAQQVYWTAVGVPAARSKSIFDEYGNVEAFKGAPLVQPLWRDASGKTAAAFDQSLKHSLRSGWMPMPAVEWSPRKELTIRSEAIAFEHNGAPVTLVRHRLSNTSQQRIEGQLSLIVRPMQICPPWQNAGLAPLHDVAIEGSTDHTTVKTNGRTLLHSLTPVTIRGAAPFGAHGETEVTSNAAAGTAPASLTAHDDDGLAAALLTYRIQLDPGTHRDVVIAFPLGNERIDPIAKVLPAAPNINVQQLAGKEAGATFEIHANAVAQQWQTRVGSIDIQLPDQSLVNMLRAQAAYMLINQTGPAIQPGPRNYNRSFIRDGSATAAILVRMGMAKEARDYLRWYATHALHDNGLVSPILNDDGTVNTGFGSDLEHDSQGELIWLIAEIARLDGGANSVREYQPTVKLALKFLQELRERTLVPGYLANQPAPERFRGIIAPSISHEGYSTPTHSYWDDYWALKGWQDGAWLAQSWGDVDMARWANEQYNALRESMAASIRATMKWKGADFIPAAADLGDGDPTSVSIGIDPTGQQDLMPADALTRTFERYLSDVRKRDLPNALYAYTPYEMRNVLTYVHLNQPQEANELLMNLLRHRRPAEWQVLAEVVYSDLRHAIYLGDMPHTWIGSEYARSIFGMLMHEGKELQLLPGTPPSWVNGEGLRVAQLPTAFGKLTMSARQTKNTLRVTLTGVTDSTALQVSWPSRKRPARVTVDGVAQSTFDANGIHLAKPFKTLEAQW